MRRLMRILVIEDDLDLADLLKADLELLGHDVELAADGRTGLIRASGQHFDAVVLDLMVPELDGPSLLQQLRAAGRRLPILVLTSLGSTSEKIRLLHAGADEYVVKPASGAEIDARLGALVRGRSWTTPEMDTIKAGEIVVIPLAFRAFRNGRPIDLVKLELKLLAELARHAGHVLSHKMLIEKMWDGDSAQDEHIVSTYIRRLRIKLTSNGEPDPIVTYRGVGYMLKAG
jgi:two-component system, OmpR family, response regulator